MSSPTSGTFVSLIAVYILATSVRFANGAATSTAPIATQRGSARSILKAKSTAVLVSIWASVLKKTPIAAVLRGVTGRVSRRFAHAIRASLGAELSSSKARSNSTWPRFSIVTLERSPGSAREGLALAKPCASERGTVVGDKIEAGVVATLHRPRTSPMGATKTQRPMRTNGARGRMPSF